MSKTREQRVEEGLAQLVERTLHGSLEDGDVISDERYYNALVDAKDIIENKDIATINADINHVNDLIKQKLVREYDTPDKALRYSNLSSRLLSQPVLSQKWAILYLLYQLSNATVPKHNCPAADPSLSSSSQDPPLKSHPQLPQPAQQDEEVFKATSSRATLSSYPSPQLRETQRTLPFNGFPRRRKDEDTREDNNDRWDTNSFGQEVKTPPSESSLLRDLPFTLQGISTTNLKFLSSASLKLPQNLPAPLISLLNSLAEPSLLYRELAKWLDSTDGGLVGQSLRAAIGMEMRSYLALVAALESQIRRALSVLDEKHSRRSLGHAGVTLKRCVLWTRDATLGLRIMSALVEESKGRKGGQLISLIHSFASLHGDPFVSDTAERLLCNVTRPFHDMLRSWIYDGELSDPYFEFFVLERRENADADTARGGAMSVWEDKYKLDEQMIPSIITLQFAKKIFLIGKSLNFIRYGCGDSAWVESYSKKASKQLTYGDTATLEKSIDEAYKTTMARLMELLNQKFMLQQHLAALKKYLLLGQGDFIAILQESLSSSLDRPANSQSRHTLTAQLEHAIRNSNAQHDSPEVLRRLDARMLEMSYGEIGWDVFTLEYKIDTPIDVIITPYGSRQYLKVFNFLWRVKRVEYALDSTWRRCMTGARGMLSNVGDRLSVDWKAAHCSMAEMVHFVCQLQYYILFEVIEASWEQLQRAVTKPDCTLDDLIEAHAQYLRAITRKGLLGTSSLDFPGQLHELLKIMLAYKEAVDGLYSFSVAAFTRGQEGFGRSKMPIADGLENDDDELSAMQGGRKVRSRDADSPMPPPLLALEGFGDEGSVLSVLRQRLTELSSDFRARVCSLLGDLAHQPDTELRFLGVVMNFNDTYKVVRRSRRKGVESEKRKEQVKEKEEARPGSVMSSQRSTVKTKEGGHG